MAAGTEFACDFCAGIGPLQLGVVLVLYIFKIFFSLETCLFNRHFLKLQSMK